MTQSAKRRPSHREAMTVEMRPAFMNRANAARYLGISTETLDRRVTDGTISAYHLGENQRLLFKVAELETAPRPVAAGNVA